MFNYFSDWFFDNVREVIIEGLTQATSLPKLNTSTTTELMFGLFGGVRWLVCLTSILIRRLLHLYIIILLSHIRTFVMKEMSVLETQVYSKHIILAISPRGFSWIQPPWKLLDTYLQIYQIKVPNTVTKTETKILDNKTSMTIQMALHISPAPFFVPWE